jgi:hypothetical protein
LQEITEVDDDIAGHKPSTGRRGLSESSSRISSAKAVFEFPFKVADGDRIDASNSVKIEPTL